MNWISIAAILLSAAVATGAFGAHALKARLDAYSLGIWEKAVFYHFIHALGILLIAVLARTETGASFKASPWLLALGIFFFSGSLYALALSGIRVLGAITPVGGLCFIAGWLMLAVEAWRSRA